ncbi:MAG: Glycosyl hydrolase, BNR repeat protein [Parcubacteria group bacterium GW2011_GWE2_39_37]|uniref:Glycosyl hydrolase, BNR repeat protein n=1 Tax=Candidatus Falkowbacteria bacterium GW2011_GWF2_39_8 TaxID=1618642 RepID=A0A0G0PVE1_9BACT|nr:MAG: Glycosyl hydrolase, BNR repeat protein [Parcubacteria group bacterium GW2011_GWE2_39_37]KKR31898.1 MAG: Glycosyl hydrolase, BNR repeat protein [Candidatus Falkowbacteria bacterium GW2011_GWF2_39_8]
MNKKFIFLTLLLLPFVLSGCGVTFSNGGGELGGGNDGGIYRSDNKGSTWMQKTLIPSVAGKPGNFGFLDSYSLAIDPSDSKAIYLGMIENGLIYSYDRGDGWHKANGLSQATIRSIAIDPNYKCTLYVTVDNKVMKSNDCSRTWAQAFYDNDLALKVNTIVIDPIDGNNVFIGTSRGEVIKSTNRGGSWQTINRFDANTTRLIISPENPKIMFAATEGRSLHFSEDAGNNWVKLDESLKDFKDSVNFKDLVFSTDKPNRVFLASRYGLLRSDNLGRSWEKIELITPEAEATINSLAVSPKNDNEIYYVTNTTFYRTADGGKSWTTKKLPTSRVGWRLKIDPDNPSILYLAVRQIK